MWPFHWWLWNYLRHAKVCFHPNVFYRNVLVFESGEGNMARDGIDSAKRHVDDYRAGLESILFGAAMNMGLPLNSLVGPGALALLNAFTTSRAEVAGRLFLADKDYIASYEFYSRCLLWNALPPDKVKALDDQIRVPAAAQALIGIFEQTPNMAEIAVCEVDNPEALIRLFRDLRRDLPIRSRSYQELIDGDYKEALIVVERPQARQRFLDAGIPAGRVYSFQETCDCYRLLPVRLDKQKRGER